MDLGETTKVELSLASRRLQSRFSRDFQNGNMKLLRTFRLIYFHYCLLHED